MGGIERVLVLDENEPNMLFFNALLTQMDRGFEIFTTTSGKVGEELVLEHKIQFVVCAWEMEEMPGTIFVQRIRANKNRRYIPCMIFSKTMKEEDITLTKELGFEDILGMPFDRAAALELLTEIIDRESEISPEEKKLRKIESLIGESNPTEALRWFDADLTKKKGPFQERAKIALAEVWMQTRNFEKSETMLRDVLKGNPNSLEAQKILARLCSLTERHDEAISILEEMSQKSPKNITSLLCLGSAFVSAERHDEARAVFDRAESLDSGSSQVTDERAKLAFKEGDIPLAAQLLAQTQCGDELVRHFNNIAIAKVAGGYFEEAVGIYHNAIKLLGDKAKLHLLHYNLGLAWKKKGDTKASFCSFCASYIAEPAFEKAYTALAIAARALRASGDAVDSQLVFEVTEARTTFKDGAPSEDEAA